jgi:hypothetical protein
MIAASPVCAAIDAACSFGPISRAVNGFTAQQAARSESPTIDVHQPDDRARAHDDCIRAQSWRATRDAEKGASPCRNI